MASREYVLPLALRVAFRHLESERIPLLGFHLCDKVNAEGKVQKRYMVLLTDGIASATEQGVIKRFIPYSHISGVLITTTILERGKGSIDRPAIGLRVPSQYDLLVLPIGSADLGRSDPKLVLDIMHACSAQTDDSNRPLPVVERQALYGIPPSVSKPLGDLISSLRLRKPASWSDVEVNCVMTTPSLFSLPSTAALVPPSQPEKADPRRANPVGGDGGETSPPSMQDEASARRQRVGELAATLWMQNPESSAYELKRENEELHRRVVQLEAELQYWRSKFLRSPPRQQRGSGSYDAFAAPASPDDRGAYPPLYLSSVLMESHHPFVAGTAAVPVEGDDEDDILVSEFVSV